MNNPNPIFGPIPQVVLILAVFIGTFEICINIVMLPLWDNFGAFSRTDVMSIIGFDPFMFRFQLKLSILFRDAIGFVAGAPLTLMTYLMVHTSFLAAAFSVVFILCFGSLLSRFIQQWVIATTFCLSGAFGALAFAALPFPSSMLIGAAPAYLGMLGLLAGIMLMEYGKCNPIISPGLVGFPYLLIGIIIVQDIIFGPSGYWAAKGAGFCTGLLLSLQAVQGSRQCVISGLRRLSQN